MQRHISASQGNIPKLVKDVNKQNFFTSQLSIRKSQEEIEINPPLSNEPSQNESHERHSTVMKTLNKTPSLSNSAIRQHSASDGRTPEYKPIQAHNFKM